MTSWSQLDNRNLDPGGGQEVRPWQVGDVIMCYGVLATLLADRPGFALMDGTVTLPGGVTPPSMVDSVPIGAGNLYALGTTGGSATQADHGHHNHPYTNANFIQAGAGLAVNPNIAIGNESATLSHGSNLPPYAALYFLIYTGNV